MKTFACSIAIATVAFSMQAASQGVMSMTDVRDTCGPRFGHHGFIEQTECVLRVMARSDNPDLMPTDPYIGWYTQMASKMIDDVRNNRISETDARDNVQQAYHEVLLRQQQAANDLVACNN
jgi:hypothetical protein